MFKVPEKYRVKTGPLRSDASFGNNGAFSVNTIKFKRTLQCIASDGEQWLPILGYEDLYEVSNFGKVRSFYREVRMPNGGIRQHHPHDVSIEVTRKGYLRVSLCRNGNIDKRLLHVIVAEAFINRPHSAQVVNHIDGDKCNAMVTNLEWCTEAYNHHHAIESGLRSGLKEHEINQIKCLLADGLTCHEVADQFNRSRQTISDIKFGRHRDLAHTETWRYAGVPFWEHVSVSVYDRCPTWEEMSFIKSLFWSDDDMVVQFHPVKAVYVNNHQFCLHLWRKAGTNDFCETPPAYMVGIKIDIHPPLNR